MLFGCFGSAGSTEKSVGPEAFGTRIMSSKKLATTVPLASLACIVALFTRARDRLNQWMPEPTTPASSIVTAFGTSALTVLTTLLLSPTIPTDNTSFEASGRVDLEMTLVGPVGGPNHATGVTKSTDPAAATAANSSMRLSIAPAGSR